MRMRNAGLSCSFETCERKASKRGWCELHYQQWRAHGGVTEQIRTSGRTCDYPECSKPHKRYGWCDGHSMQARKVDNDVTRMRPLRNGRAHRAMVNGYVKVYRPEHPNAHSNGWAFEHTVVMSEHVGRPLVAGENVHHVNGFKDDNRLENLELWNTHQPKGQRVEDKVAWAIEMLRLYRPEVLSNEATRPHPARVSTRSDAQGCQA